MILGVLAFWLFAQTTLNISTTMAADLGIQMSVMNIAVSITALFSGIFIVVVGGLADRVGRVKVVQWGFVLSIVGSLLVGLAPSGALASASLILGRICQGLSGACIMPASLALAKTYWEGAGRQRAVSLWSMGSWGGSGFAALFGGLMAENVGWRWIFFASVAVSVIGMLMVRGTPESRGETSGGYKFDARGVLTLMVAMVALQVFATQGAKPGWTSVAALALLATGIVFGVIFVRTESGNRNAFVDFRLFGNLTYTGATLSNLLLNAAAGILIVAMTLVQIGGGMSAQGAGLLLMPSYVLLATYKILAIVAFTLFGIGLAFYATPSTDAALANLPDDQAGAGSGIYKMASSLGASFGVAISAAIFTALSGDNAPVDWIAGLITFVGRQDNLAIREAALFAFGANLLMVAAAIVSIMVTVPAGKLRPEPGK